MQVPEGLGRAMLGLPKQWVSKYPPPMVWIDEDAREY